MFKKFLLLLLLFASPIIPDFSADAPTHNRDFTPSRLQHKIMVQEGFPVKGTLPNRYNNPGALRYAHQPGAKRGWDNYAHFDTFVNGWNAFAKLTARYRREHIPFKKGWPYLTEKDKEWKLE